MNESNHSINLEKQNTKLPTEESIQENVENDSTQKILPSGEVRGNQKEWNLLVTRERITKSPYRVGTNDRLEEFYNTMMKSGSGATIKKLEWHESHLGETQPIYEGLFKLLITAKNEEDRKMFADVMNRLLELSDEQFKKAVEHFS